ncbi:hypothetical protein IGI39_002258 [Enterococcus sp. AZ135]
MYAVCFFAPHIFLFFSTQSFTSNFSYLVGEVVSEEVPGVLVQMIELPEKVTQREMTQSQVVELMNVCAMGIYSGKYSNR